MKIRLLISFSLIAFLVAPSFARLPRTIDLQGRIHDLGNSDRKATVIVFLSTECPIGNRYIPTLNALTREVELFAVISDRSVTRVAALKWQKDYAIEFPVILDTDGEIARSLAPVRTPEAFLLDANGALRYRGRINNAFESLGKPRQNVDRHDLADAIAAVAEGKEVAKEKTEAVGCVFKARAMPTTTRPAVTYARDVAPILYANCV